ncbi:MAG: serine hydrolase domain-containing protein, partial [Bacteroidota bacterium]
ALLKAQEMGKLDLDDPIENYLPFKVTNPYHPQEKITIRHLATHTSTITDTDFYNAKAYILKSETPDLNANLNELNENFNPPDSRIPMKDFLQKIVHEEGEWYQKEGFTTHKPGQLFEYSNIGATLAAVILEIAVGEPYDEFTAKHILNPLKMSSSGWSFEHIDMTNHSKLYANPETEIPFYSLITYPDGGLITNIEDLGKYLAELIKGYSGEGTLLQDESYKELFSEQLQPENFPERDEENAYNDEYNTGIFMGFTPKGYIGHTGGDPGIGTYMFFNPKTKLGKILVINTSIINAEGVKEFFSVWKTLEEFETEFDKTGS